MQHINTIIEPKSFHLRNQKLVNVIHISFQEKKWRDLHLIFLPSFLVDEGVLVYVEADPPIYFNNYIKPQYLIHDGQLYHHPIYNISYTVGAYFYSGFYGRR